MFLKAAHVHAISGMSTRRIHPERQNSASKSRSAQVMARHQTNTTTIDNPTQWCMYVSSGLNMFLAL